MGYLEPRPFRMFSANLLGKLFQARVNAVVIGRSQNRDHPDLNGLLRPGGTPGQQDQPDEQAQRERQFTTIGKRRTGVTENEGSA